jgi:hypothetical protein
MISMNPLRPGTVARALELPPPLSLPAAFSEQLSNLYSVVQRSQFVFGSPLGPIALASQEFHVPRFVYFGPHASDAALRLSFLAGFEHADLRPTFAVLRLIEQLALSPDWGQGLNLSFFPLVDVLGLAGVTSRRNLAGQPWSRAHEPEIELLERDARLRAYHGFVRLETIGGNDAVTVRLSAPAPDENFAPALEVVSSQDTEPFPVRWETDSDVHTEFGPLSIADDLPLRPFELTVGIPAAWSLDLYAEAASSILKRFVLRHRGFMSYGQHL